MICDFLISRKKSSCIIAPPTYAANGRLTSVACGLSNVFLEKRMKLLGEQELDDNVKNEPNKRCDG